MNTTTELLSVSEAAERRRSIRSYEPEPVPREDVEEILRLTGLAPSAFNVQPWRFVVVRTPELKEKLAAAAFNQRQVHSAPVVIVLYTDVRDALEHVDEVLHPGIQAEERAGAREGVLRPFASMSESELESWGAEQGHIALGYLLLVAEAHGYQTSAMAGFDKAQVKELLGLPEHVRVPALIAIGHGAEAGFEHHRHPVTRVARVA